MEDADCETTDLVDTRMCETGTASSARMTWPTFRKTGLGNVVSLAQHIAKIHAGFAQTH
jgi:hypothetical protein